MKELIIVLIVCIGLLLLFPERVERFESLREYSDVVRKVQKKLDLQGTDVIQVHIKDSNGPKDQLTFHVVDRATLKAYLIESNKKGQLKKHKPLVPNKTSKHALFFAR